MEKIDYKYLRSGVILPFIILAFEDANMPQRVAQGFKTIAGVLGAGGGIIAYLVAAPRYIGLTPALTILNAVLLSIVLYSIWLLHKDLEEINDPEPTSADDEEIETVDVSESQSSGDQDLVTDGGITLSPKLQELQEESPEGGGALAGLVAGGALGLLGGPAGVVIGGIAGGLLGNEYEYQQIVERYRQELGNTAKNALGREGVYAPRPYSVENINHRSSDDTFAILIKDSRENFHRIRLDLNDRRYEYEEVGNELSA